MRGLTDIYATLFRTDLAVQFQYRAEMIIWLIFRIVEALVFLSVWTAVADSQGGQVGAIDVLHGHEGLLASRLHEVVNADDVRVAETATLLCLAL